MTSKRGKGSRSNASDREMPVDDQDIYVSATGDALADIATEFAAEARRSGARVHLEEKHQSGVYAGLEWVVPTAIAVFLANQYVGTLLQEAAKDHYPTLKAAFRRLVRRTTGQDREVSIKIVSAGAAKVRDADPATLSLWVALGDSRRIVFRFDHELSPQALDAATDELFALLLSYAPDDDAHLLARAPALVPNAPWAPVVLRFDETRNAWRPWILGPSGQAEPWAPDARSGSPS